ncbi:MAG: TonB-dependent receptor plug domain-containing protein [Acidobacteriota bacterium]
MSSTAARLLLIAALVAAPASARAQRTSGQSDLAIASLEDLLNIQITSASRREQRVEDTPGAAYVITQDDIRRSGIRLLPELFRLVPGMQVSQIGSSEWAVSSRGFNSRYANKVLVLVDGRSIYNRAFTGVFWNSQEMMLDDIERIEVIRGPGGAVWGADAVNGVINIITKSADKTQGLLVRAGTGTFDGSQGAVRYGGTFGSAAYRVFTQWSKHEATVLSTGAGSAGDSWTNSATGLRLDWSKGKDAFLVEGTLIDSDTNDLVSGRTGTAAIAATNAAGAAWHQAVLGRWIRTTDHGTLKVQSFVNHNVTGPSGAGPDDRNNETIADMDVQYNRRFGNRHDTVVGGGYRYAAQHNVPSGQLSVVPADSTGDITNLFAQDEIAVVAHVKVTVGSKFERDSGSGWDAQPTARVMWDLGRADQRIWAAASHALRTPAPYDTNLQIAAPLPPSPSGLPMSLAISGNPDYPTEALNNVEVGYRVSVGPRVSVDAVAFNGHYDRLPALHPLGVVLVTSPTPHLVVRQAFSNSMNAESNGVEILGRIRPAAQVSVEASYSHLGISRSIDAGSLDTANPNFTDNSPTDQWQVRVWSPLGRHVEAGGALFHVGDIADLAIPAFTRADLNGRMTFGRGLSVMVSGQNLLQADHLEAVQNSLAQTRVPRSGSVHVTWQF